MDNEIIENLLNFDIICMNIFQSHLFVSNIEKYEGINHVCLVIDYTEDNAREKNRRIITKCRSTVYLYQIMLEDT